MVVGQMMWSQQRRTKCAGLNVVGSEALAKVSSE